MSFIISNNRISNNRKIIDIVVQFVAPNRRVIEEPKEALTFNSIIDIFQILALFSFLYLVWGFSSLDRIYH